MWAKPQSRHPKDSFYNPLEEPDCGVLILSEFSGSAQSLRAAAICPGLYSRVTVLGFLGLLCVTIEADIGPL